MNIQISISLIILLFITNQSKFVLVLDTEQNACVDVMTLDTSMETTATAILCTVWSSWFPSNIIISLAASYL